MALAGDAWREGTTARLNSLLESAEPDLRGWEWRFLSAQADTSDLVLDPRAQAVSPPLWTPDGRTIVAGVQDPPPGNAETFAFWNSADGTLERRLEAPHRTVWMRSEPSLSADGRLLAVRGGEREILLWDVSSGDRLPNLPVQLKPGATVPRFAPVGHLLALSGPGPIELWDADRRERLGVLDAEQDYTTTCFSPDATRLYSASWDGSVAVFDVETRKPLTVLREHADRINYIDASADGRWFATGGWENRVFVWDARTHQVVHRTPILDGFEGPLAWSPDSELLAIGVRSVVRLMEAGRWVEATSLVGHEGRLASVRFDPTGGRVMTTAEDLTVRIWDLTHPERGLSPTVRGETVLEPRFTSDGRRVMVPFRASGEVQFWNVAERKLELVRRFPIETLHLDMSCDGRRLVVHDPPGTIRILDVASGATLGTLPSTTVESVAYNPHALSFSPDAARFSVVASDGTLSVHDSSNLERLWRVTAHDGTGKWPFRIGGGCWSPDGARILTLPCDGRAQVWNARTGTLESEWKLRCSAGQRGAFSADGGRVFVSGFTVGGLECWDVATRACVWELPGEGPSCVLFSARHDRLFSIGAPAVDIRNPGTGELIVSLSLDPYLNYGLGVSPVDDEIVTASPNGLKFWDTRPRR